MKIEKIKLRNFRSAKETVFNFTDQLNLFVGINGAGKSTVLEALSICLSWLVKRIERENGRGAYISDSRLRIGEEEGFLDIQVSVMNTSFRWFLTKSAKGKSSSMGSQLEGVSTLAKEIKISHEQNMSWPIIAYYPVNRVVNSIRPEIPDRDSIYNLDVYENALGGKANYQSFFEWFRLQDDILNEKAMSRSKWMQQNRNWIKRRVHRLFSLLKDSVVDDEKHFDQEEFKYITKQFWKDEMFYEEPRFLFRELSHLTDMIGMRSRKHFDYDKILHDLEYMFHKMGTFSGEFRDDLIEKGGIHEEIVKRIIHNFEHIWREKKPDDKMADFLWESFSFAVLLSLWWMSDKGKRNLEREFRLLRGPLGISGWESSNTTAEKFSATLRQVIRREVQQKKDAYRNEGQELNTVTKAIEKFVPEYTHLRVKRVPRPHMLIDKKDETFNLDQLSDGEKNLIALVGDIARRLAIGNPDKKDPLKGDGIVLIDEIDLHLHPSWQRLVVPKLLEVFPNCQFFISTHSPQVISHVRPEGVFLLEQTEGCLTYSEADETYGMSLDRVVELVMDDESRPDLVKNDLDKLFELIERKKITKANKLLTSLKKDMRTDPELMRAEMLIRREEMKG
jgi:predicted ATP-binding protein involved in virulence